MGELWGYKYQPMSKYVKLNTHYLLDVVGVTLILGRSDDGSEMSGKMY